MTASCGFAMCKSTDIFWIMRLEASPRSSTATARAWACRSSVTPTCGPAHIRELRAAISVRLLQGIEKYPDHRFPLPQADLVLGSGDIGAARPLDFYHADGLPGRPAMNGANETVPSVLNRIRKTLVGLKMPKAFSARSASGPFQAECSRLSFTGSLKVLHSSEHALRAVGCVRHAG
jgi:hypothetical protein